MVRNGSTGRRRSPAFDPDAMLRAVVGLYETALDGDVVAPTLNTLAPLFGSRMGAYVRIDRSSGVTHGSHFSGGDVERPGVYEYTAEDIGDDYLYNATQEFQAGTTYLGSDIIASETLRRSSIFRRLVAPQSLEFIVGGVLENGGECYSALGFWRAGNLGNYTDKAKQALSLAVPHVRNAIHVSRRLAEAEGMRREGLEVLERTRHGVLLIAPSGRSIFVNREAERIARLGDGICLRQGRVVFADPRTSALARDLVDLAAANGNGRSPAAGRTFFVSRPSGRLPYEVLVVPLTAGSRAPVTGTVMMLISDPLEAFAIPFHKLVDDYGLTHAEARFCRALLTEGSMQRAADSIEVSINTGRSHLKKIFVKLGVKSQSQLFRLFGAGLRG